MSTGAIAIAGTSTIACAGLRAATCLVSVPGIALVTCAGVVVYGSQPVHACALVSLAATFNGSAKVSPTYAASVAIVPKYRATMEIGTC